MELPELEEAAVAAYSLVVRGTNELVTTIQDLHMSAYNCLHENALLKARVRELETELSGYRGNNDDTAIIKRVL